MPYIATTDGGSIFYTDEGAGPGILMIRGWSCDGSDWAWMQADFARDHRTIAIDNRGHGRSSTADSYSPALFAADAATVIEALDLGRPIVVGHSMGTIVASALAVERPELVSRLVLIDPVYGSERSALSAALDGVRAAPHEFATMAWGQFYGDRTPDWLPVWHRRRILSTDPQTVRDALVGLYEGEGAIGLKEVGVRYLPRRQAPILAIYAGSGAGVADWDSSLRHGAQDVIEVWPEHGHFLHQEDPDRFSRRVREWLEQLEPTVV